MLSITLAALADGATHGNVKAMMVPVQGRAEKMVLYCSIRIVLLFFVGVSDSR